MAKGSWRDTPEYTHSEEHPQPHMRPSISALITKLKRLNSLKDHPDAVVYVIEQLAHYSFVHERLRPQQAFQAMQSLFRTWERALGSPHSWDGHDVGNDRLLESVQNAVTGDELPKKQSLPTWDELEELKEWLMKGRQVYDSRIIDAFLKPMEEALLKSQSLGDRLREHVEGPDDEPVKKRNNTTPGPSHKSPVGFKGAGEVGFTIPGFDGKWLWKGPGKPPDMDAVVATLTEGVIGGRSPEIDLNDKGLKKRVRQIIFSHTFDTNFDTPTCSCEMEFDIAEEWASHVRKLIWKELKRSGESD
jgi:hypothetical protein